jgi:hypothetical protein
VPFISTLLPTSAETTYPVPYPYKGLADIVILNKLFVSNGQIGLYYNKFKAVFVSVMSL